MSTEQQLKVWLQRAENTFNQNLLFAIRTLNSAEFTFLKKYEIIFDWIADEGIKHRPLPISELQALFELRMQTSLVTLQTKEKFVRMLLHPHHYENKTPTAEYLSLLSKLLAAEWLQDLLRNNHNIKACVYSTFLKCFEATLNDRNCCGSEMTIRERNLFCQVLSHLKEHTQNAADKHNLAVEYDSHVFQPLAQVVLKLRFNFNTDFFSELCEIEQHLRVCTIPILEALMLQLPMHCALVMLECVITNRRLEQNFHIELLKCIFRNCKRHEINAHIVLTRAAYVLNVMQKHNMLLNYEIDGKSVISFLGDHIYRYAAAFKDAHLDEVLLILCAALRLNPLILEQHIFEMTTWIIVAPKDTSNADKTQKLFEEFLALLLEMFRRLSRAEKFVVNLLKALSKWLSENELQPARRKLNKRKLEETKTAASKRKKADVCENEISEAAAEANLNHCNYVDILLNNFTKQKPITRSPPLLATFQKSFLQLQSFWPSETIGLTFSRLITGLVTKASLTIWKTLLYALKDQLELVSQKTQSLNSENSHFRIEFHAALLCQYFAGAKLNEQYEKYANDIKQQCEFTNQLLSCFGKFALNNDAYQKRTVNAFLECCYYAANFELLLAYYKPDGFSDVNLTEDHLMAGQFAYLSPQQWSLIHERIRNNGKQHERKLFERLLLQRAECRQLLQTEPQFQKNLSATIDDVALPAVLLASPHADWLIAQMNRKQKIALIDFHCEHLNALNGSKFLKFICENAEALELLAYALFERIIALLSELNQSSLTVTLNCCMDSVRAYGQQEHAEFDKLLKSLVASIGAHFGNHKINCLPMDIIENLLQLLTELPLSALRRQPKTLIFIFLLTLYHDLKTADAESQARRLLDYLTDFLHFGPQIPIFRYFDIKLIQQLLPIADCWHFYEFLFSTIKTEERGTDEFLKALEELLRAALKSSGTLKKDERRLLLIAIETFGNLSGQIGRRIFKHFYNLLEIYGSYIYAYFDDVPATTSETTDTQKSKKFVEKTLAGFGPFLKAILVTKIKSKNEAKNEEICNVDENSQENHQYAILKPLDEKLRQICKIYIGHSVDYRNPHAIRLMQVALNNRKLLHLDQDEIELVLTGYWRQLNADMQQQQLFDSTGEPRSHEENRKDLITKSAAVQKNAEALMRMLIENKTNEDLLLTLKQLASNINSAHNLATTLQLLKFIGKSKFSTIKGAIFNEQFKQITSNIIQRLHKNSQQQFTNRSVVLKLLCLQEICVDNKTIPITPDTIDVLLAFLIGINIKSYSQTETDGAGVDTADLFVLHAAMTSLCITLVKQRHVLLMDRVPVFMQIFKDLLQSVLQYRCERQNEATLQPNELNQLAELCLKLEVLMHNIAAHSTDVKRVAPFVLIFIINFMVTCKRSTSLYSKIKTHVYSICYSLIGICDHRIGRFILRASNEAASQTYEQLVKDHKKYHKFKGKV